MLIIFDAADAAALLLPDADIFGDADAIYAMMLMRMMLICCQRCAAIMPDAAYAFSLP